MENVFPLIKQELQISFIVNQNREEGYSTQWTMKIDNEDHRDNDDLYGLQFHDNHQASECEEFKEYMEVVVAIILSHPQEIMYETHEDPVLVNLRGYR